MAPRKANTSNALGQTAGRPSNESETGASVKKRKRSSVDARTPPKRRARSRRVRAEDDDDVEEQGEPQEDVAEIDSDALDDTDDERVPKRKRKTATSTPRRTKRKTKAQDEEDDGIELEEGQEIVGRVVKAPTTGLVPPGQISRNTFNFLNKLKDPECNDRQWFKLHEPVYRLAEKEWKDFVEAFTNVLIEVDAEIPPLPPKDVTHRIYRDIRFSNDKTPYKTGLSASFSRSGRKGIFAGYHVAVKPGNESLIAAGSWCPAKNELDTLRANIKRDPRRLRQVISSSEFERYFGKARPHPKGERQNIFGMEDELKTAPKGVAKDHKDIDLLKCRSFAVVHRFTDSEVLSPDFKDKVGMVARVMCPLVHCLNDMMTITVDDDQDGDNEE